MGGFLRGDASAFFDGQSLSGGDPPSEGHCQPVFRAIRVPEDNPQRGRCQAGETNRRNLPALSLQHPLEFIKNLTLLFAAGLGLQLKCQIVRHNVFSSEGVSHRLARLSTL